MKSINYKVLSGIADYTVPKTASLTELIQDIPNLLVYKIIPSFDILNSLLKSGVSNAGMSGGCEWPFFELNQDEYNELVDALIKNNPYLFTAIPPEWVHNYSEWHVWIMGKLYKVPVEKHLELTRIYEEAEAKVREAQKNNKEELVSELHLKAVEAGNELSEFVMANLRR